MVDPVAAIPVSTIYAGIDLMGLVSANVWDFLDHTFMVDIGGGTVLSLLDWLFIGTGMVDFAFEIYYELMP